MPNRTQVDYLISARWIIPVVPQNTIFENCSVAIQHGVIINICPKLEAEKLYSANHSLNLENHVLMPGLVNAHGHAAMSLLRGYADDLPLMTWLQDHIWPAESKWVSESFVKDGTLLAAAEMIRSGTTTFSDMYFYPEVAAEVAKEVGLRAQICFPILDFPTNWGSGADEYIHKGLQLRDDYKSFERITIGFGPHAPYTVSDQPFARIVTLAEELQAPIQIHLHETASEVDEAVQTKGQRPIARMKDLGVLGPNTQCVHMTQLTDEDIATVKETGASVVHCPESNMKLASGICPIQKLLDNDITVALGTDGPASNNDLDMFGELASAALLAKVGARDAAAVSAESALYMATMGGAKALGIDKITGSLETGKKADLIAVSMDDINLMPCYNVMSQLVYNNRHTRVSHMWVSGKILLSDGKLLTINAAEVKQKAAHWQGVLS